MKYFEDCPHCHRRVTAYTLPLNEGLIRAFLIFAVARIKAGRPVKKGELGLENSQYSNFQNLRHFALVAQLEKGRHWEMTPLGWNFLRGRTSILNPAAHLGGATLSPFHPAWGTHKEARQLVHIHDVMPEEWKDRAEFKQEKTG